MQARPVLCRGSVTCDGALFPAMYSFIHHLAGKNLRGRRVAVVENGSWTPLAGKRMCDMLEAMRDMTVVSPVVTIRSRMHDSDIPALASLADALTEE